MRFRFGLGFLVHRLEVGENRKLVLQDTAGDTDSFFRIDRAIGFDVDDQLVEVGALFDARGFDAVSDLTHRRK